jgi:hypothetical protein
MASTLRESEFDFQQDQENFSVFRSTNSVSWTHPSCCSFSTGLLSLVVKEPLREAYCLPPCSAEVKNALSCESTPQFVFMAWCVLKHRDGVTSFTLIRSSSNFIICLIKRRRLRNEELHHLYSSPNIIRLKKSRRMIWAGPVARIGKRRGAYRFLVGTPEGMRSL